jgi:hypothetical protein
MANTTVRKVYYAPMGGAPRIAPGTAADIGRVNWLIALNALCVEPES